MCWHLTDHFSIGYATVGFFFPVLTTRFCPLPGCIHCETFHKKKKIWNDPTPVWETFLQLTLCTFHTTAEVQTHGNPSGCVYLRMCVPGKALRHTQWADGPPAGNNDPRHTLKLIMPLWGHRVAQDCHKTARPGEWQRERERETPHFHEV